MDQFFASQPGHPVLTAAARIGAVLKDVRDVEPTFMSAADKRAALVALPALRDELEALWLRVIDVADDLAEVTGARDVAAWLTAEARIDRPTAAGSQRLAHALGRRWLELGQAVGERRVAIGQARVISECLDALAEDDQVSAEVLGKAEAELVRLAGTHTPSQLRRLGERIVAIVAPQLGDERDRAALERAERRASAATRLCLRRRGDGSSDLHARIPDAVAARLKTYLDAYTAPRTADGPRGGVIDRATGARVPHDRLLGEAFCSLLEAVPAEAMPLHGGSATQLVVTIELEACAPAWAPPSPGTAPPSPQPEPGDSPAGPGSSPPCWAEPASRSTSEGAGVCSVPPSAPHWPSSTPPVVARAAPCLPPGARPTTPASPGPEAAGPTSPRAGSCALGITTAPTTPPIPPNI